MCIYIQRVQLEGWSVCAASAKYMVQVLPVLLDASKNRDPHLRQCAVYGLGVLAEHRPDGFRQIAATAIQTLLAVIKDAEARFGLALFQLVQIFSHIAELKSRSLTPAWRRVLHSKYLEIPNLTGHSRAWFQAYSQVSATKAAETKKAT